MLAARLAATTRTATPITLYYAGAGLGIALSGAAIPLLLQGHPDRWPLAWVGLALAAALATAASWGAACGDRDQVARPTGRRRLRLLWPVTVAYVLFATGYLAYLTFLSVYLVDHHATATQVALTWSLLGAAVVAAPSLWSRPITAWPGTWALAALLLGLGAAAALLLGLGAAAALLLGLGAAAALLLGLLGAAAALLLGLGAAAALLLGLGAAAALPLLSSEAPLVLASAVAYGATLMSVPAAVTALVRTHTEPAGWTPTLAALTALFAAGQAAGPWAAGALAELTSSDAGLAWTAALCVAAGVLAIAQRPTSRP